ncbi:MAG: hypothetical protein M3Q73_02305 [bacterium]|nr:hypothetical protein [bacterium]
MSLIRIINSKGFDVQIGPGVNFLFNPHNNELRVRIGLECLYFEQDGQRRHCVALYPGQTVEDVISLCNEVLTRVQVYFPQLRITKSYVGEDYLIMFADQIELALA